MRLDESPQLTELASGVDSLYLSGRGVLPDLLVTDLKDARAHAVDERCAVPFAIGATTFGVAGYGVNRYPFRLEHPHGMIALTTSSSLPTVMVQPRASFIHAVGAWAAGAWFRDVVELLLGTVAWQVSRLDLFMDSHGWALGSEDRGRFVNRAEHVVIHEADDQMETLAFGIRGAAIKARIYDKTIESRASGSDWWPLVWGEAYRPGERVLRVEFEVRRAALKQTQINSPEDARERTPQLWAHLTEKWLSYRTPTADETRSRWPVAPEWRQIQQASLRGDAVGLERVTAGATSGSIRKLLPQLRGYVASAGALMGAETLDEAMHRVGRILALDEQESGHPFSHRLASKRLAVSA